MSNRIIKAVESVTRRRRRQSVADFAAAGLLFGGAASLILTLLWILDSPPFAARGVGFWTIGPTAAGLFLGAAIGRFKPIDPRQSAGLIDRHYDLKDRVLTAFQNSLPSSDAGESETPQEAAMTDRLMRILQFSDAWERVSAVDSAAVVPFRLPRHAMKTVAVAALVGIFSLIAPKLAIRKSVEAIEPIDELTTMAEEVKGEILPDLAEWEKENPDEEGVKRLREELETLIPKLAEATADPKETLATLSEIENAISEAIQSMDLASMEDAAGEMADALKSSDATEAAGKALGAGDFEKAASELERLDPTEMTKEERERLADRLDKAAQKMTRPSQKGLASQAKRFGRSLCDGNKGESSDSACRIIDYFKKFSLRKGICHSLGCKLNLLSLCKTGCCQSACRKNGGSGTNKSDSPTKNWGTGSAGDPRTGEETELSGANRIPEKATGTFGDGPSDFETVESAEGDGTATRDYREAWHDYQKISESVLRSEPIPLGKRQTIRRYFQSIRPTDDSAVE